MNKLLVFLAFIFFIPLTIFSQNRVIKGKVTDEAGAPLSGVTVLTKGAKKGVQTDRNGDFSITVSGNSTDLVISSVGFTSKIVTITGTDAGVVQLQRSVVTQDDVVVVGYATAKRKDLTGSISSVSAKQIKDIPLTSAAEALQGKLAGVQVVASDGAPGAELVIRVRGGGSITQDNSPLYIVDGVQVDNALSVIAPQDIASIDVLKDASTTAIYGARGANGVVIITTKGGRAGKTIVSYNGSFGWRELPETQKVLSAYDFVRWQYERTRGSSADSTSFAQTYGTTWDTLSNYKNIPTINWQEEVFGRRAKYQNHNVAVSGGNQTTTFNLSLSASKEDGLLLESGYDRKLANFKFDHRINEKARMGFTIRYLDQAVRGAGTTNSGTRTTNRLRHSIQYRPFEIKNAPPADEFDEAYYQASNQIQNPVILTQAEYKRQEQRGVYLTGYASYNILKNLTFRTTVGYDNTAIRQEQFWSKITPTARNASSLPIAAIGEQRNATISNSNTLQYSVNNFKKHHTFSVLIGQEIVQRDAKSTYTETRYFPADITPEKALANMGLGSAPSGATQPRPSSSVNPPYRLFSLFGRISYAYDDKFLVTLNDRNDRSSKFKYENGALNFISGSAAWRFSKHNFMDATRNWLSDGKIRFGYGAVGNDRIGDLLYQQLYGVTGEYALNHNILPGFAPSALANEDLRWERNVTMNGGLDLSFLKGRINLSVDVYKNTAKNLLLSVSIPPTTGYATQLNNVGATSNRGVEIQVGADVVQKKNFTWTSNFNIGFNRNRVDNLGGLTQITKSAGWQGSDGADDYLVRVGDPVGQMYGFVTDGYYSIDEFDYNATTKTYTLKAGVVSNVSLYGAPQPGSIKFKDLNGDGFVTVDGDRQVIGNANPKFSGGWNNQFTYKGFDASIFVNFVYGNDVYNANKIEWTDGAFPNLNMLNIMKDRFTYINDQGVRVTDPTELAALNANAKIWTPIRAQRYYAHSWAIEDGSYLRINNVTLGYTVPQKLLSRIKISSFRVYGTVNNLATLTSYSGYDPDVTTRRSDPLTPGVDFAGYPRARTFVFGVNVTF